MNYKILCLLFIAMPIQLNASRYKPLVEKTASYTSPYRLSSWYNSSQKDQAVTQPDSNAQPVTSPVITDKIRYKIPQQVHLEYSQSRPNPLSVNNPNLVTKIINGKPITVDMTNVFNMPDESQTKPIQNPTIQPTNEQSYMDKRPWLKNIFNSPKTDTINSPELSTVQQNNRLEQQPQSNLTTIPAIAPIRQPESIIEYQAPPLSMSEPVQLVQDQATRPERRNFDIHIFTTPEQNFITNQPSPVSVADIIEQTSINDVTNSMALAIEKNNNTLKTLSPSLGTTLMENNILNSIDAKTNLGLVQFNDPAVDLKSVDRLLKEYKEDKLVVKGLQNIESMIYNYMDSQNPAAKQANKAIARYYTQEMKLEIQKLFKNELITTMPTIEGIIQKALSFPSSESITALQTALEATKITQYAYRNDGSMLGTSDLQNQLQTFEKNINEALQNPVLKPFQSWGSYLASFIPSTKTVLDSTGLGDITLSTAVDYAQSAAQTVGLDKMTISQVAEKTGIIDTKNNNELIKQDTKIVGNKNAAPMSQYQQNIQQRKLTQLNTSIANYYTPTMERTIFETMNIRPTTDPITKRIDNIPAIQTIIDYAINKPSQQTYTLLDTALEATNIAIYAASLRTTILANGIALKNELQKVKNQIQAVMQDPRFAPFKSFSESITASVQSTLPSTSTIVQTGLNSTGLGNVTMHDTLNTAQTVLTTTGLGNKTIGSFAS